MIDPETILQGRYLIMRRIGHGGMGAVYLAKDQRLGSLVALKETLFTDEHLLRAFEREARLLASLRHPALPRVSDHFAEGDGQFLVMEYIGGDDLEQMLAARGYAFAPAEVLQWADQLLDALDYLHTQPPPIIHRDIKPQNLKITERGQIILLDFGLAKGAVSGMTQAAGVSSILGYTPGYAPLEQIQSAGTEARSDLFSLAATLYRLMTAVSPPDALRRATAVLNGERDPLEPAHEINPHVSAAVGTVLHRAMALRRDERPATASAMRQALREARRAPAVGAGQATTAVRQDHIPPATRPGYEQTLDAAAPASQAIEVAPTRIAAAHPGVANAPVLFSHQQTIAAPPRRVMPLLLLAGLAILAGILLVIFLTGQSTRRDPAPAQANNTAASPGGVPGGVVGGIPGGIPSGPVVEAPQPALPTRKKDEPQKVIAEDSAPPKIIRKSGAALQGSAIRRVEPAYPRLARAAQVSGAVVVEVTVDEAGNVISARAISGHPLLKPAAEAAARGWKFTPTQLSGVPVKVIGTITFNFNL